MAETPIRAGSRRSSWPTWWGNPSAELDARREAILKSIREQDKLTTELAKAIDAATTKSEIEDTCLPYKPKRRTTAMIAREKGLAPLCDAIMATLSGTTPR